MIESIKPVRYGILLGLFGIIFGILWAFCLVLGHEKIHEDLEKRTVTKQGNIIQLFAPQEAYAHSKKEMPVVMEHNQGSKEEPRPHVMGALHKDPDIELAHKILTRAHIHFMGLGLLTILISLVLAFTNATDRSKTLASVAAGLGGLIYPIAWILMGYRIPAMGMTEAEASVRIIAAPGVILVLCGIIATAFFLIRDIAAGTSSNWK